MRGTATPEAGMSAEEPVHGLASSEPEEDKPKEKKNEKVFSNLFFFFKHLFIKAFCYSHIQHKTN